MTALGVLSLVALLGLGIAVTGVVGIVVTERRVREARRPRPADVRVPQQRDPWPVAAQGANGVRRLPGH